MRSRPHVKVLLERSPLEPGARFWLDVVLVSGSHTPTDFVDVRLEGETMGCRPAGKSTEVMRQKFAEQWKRWSPGALEKGEHRQRFWFELPSFAPPSYQGGYAKVEYRARVHVSIPYWPDRRATFLLPVEAPARVPAPASPTTLVATHAEGPVAKELYIEVGVDSTQAVRGDVLSGDVSFANTGAKRVRRVTVSLLGVERIQRPGPWQHVAQRVPYLLTSGPPTEGESYPFRIQIPPLTTPSFEARLFALDWSLEVRADVVLGSDVVVAAPLEILRLPPDVTMPPRARRALPVGRERLARLWELVAQRAGFEYDEALGAMRTSSGALTLELRRETRQGTLGTTAVYRWPHLGLDVRLGEHGLFDAMTKKGYYKPRSSAAGERFTIVGREAAQLDAFFGAAVLGALVDATSAELDDDGATVWMAGRANGASALQAVAGHASQLLHIFAAAAATIPPPASVAAHVDAWRAFAQKVRGRLELGRLWIHDATQDGAFRFELGIAWEPTSPTVVGTVARFFLEPPLPAAPAVDDPALSALARERLREASALPGFHASPEQIGFVVPDAVADPQTLEPSLAAVAALVRALRGVVAAGPFR